MKTKTKKFNSIVNARKFARKKRNSKIFDLRNDPKTSHNYLVSYPKPTSKTKEKAINMPLWMQDFECRKTIIENL